MYILHLTDLHFGYKPESPIDEYSESINHTLNVSNRDVILKSIQEFMTSKGISRFDLILFTGDLFHYNAKEEKHIDETVDWFKRLIDISKVDLQKILVCPGNHDPDNDVVGKEMPLMKTAWRLMEKIGFDYNSMEKNLVSYKSVWKKLGLPEYAESSHYSTGVRLLKKFGKCYAFNSAINCGKFEDGDDFELEKEYGRLNIGYDKFKRVLNPTEDHSSFNISILHHPREFLSPDEKWLYNPKACLRHIKNCTNLRFYGHDHPQKPVQSRLLHFSKHLEIQGGALYMDYGNNNFYINNNYYNIVNLEENDKRIDINLYRISTMLNKINPASPSTKFTISEIPVESHSINLNSESLAYIYEKSKDSLIREDFDYNLPDYRTIDKVYIDKFSDLMLQNAIKFNPDFKDTPATKEVYTTYYQQSFNYIKLVTNVLENSDAIPKVLFIFPAEFLKRYGPSYMNAEDIYPAIDIINKFTCEYPGATIHAQFFDVHNAFFSKLYANQRLDYCLFNTQLKKVVEDFCTLNMESLFNSKMYFFTRLEVRKKIVEPPSNLKYWKIIKSTIEKEYPACYSELIDKFKSEIVKNV